MANLVIVTEGKLAEYTAEAKKYFVKQEEGKGLSKNDLTDELKAKILAAGDSSFTGNYDDLEGIPKLDGTEIKGTLTTEGLGIAKKSELPAKATAQKEGIVKGDGETIETTDGVVSVKEGIYATPDDIEDFVTDSEFNTMLDDYSTTTEVEGKLTALENKLKAEITHPITPKGSVEYSALPSPSADNVGWYYNVSNAFVTDDRFIEGNGLSYPAGSNVMIVEPTDDTYKFDVMAGSIDLSGYAKTSDFEVISSDAVQGMFS